MAIPGIVHHGPNRYGFKYDITSFTCRRPIASVVAVLVVIVGIVNDEGASAMLASHQDSLPLV